MNKNFMKGVFIFVGLFLVVMVAGSAISTSMNNTKDKEEPASASHSKSGKPKNPGGRKTKKSGGSTTSTIPAGTGASACKVNRLRPVYDFYLPGKLALENFTVSYNTDLLSSDSGRKGFVKAMLTLACHDPVAMASYARYTGVVPTNTSDADLNKLVQKYLNQPGVWQAHHNALVREWGKVVMIRVVPRDPKEKATTDAQRHVGLKRPPELFTEPTKGSCDIIVQLIFNGKVLQFCAGCLQPYRPHVPPAPPAPPVNPPRRCRRHCSPPRTTTTTVLPTTTTVPSTTTTSPRKVCTPDPAKVTPSLPLCTGTPSR